MFWKACHDGSTAYRPSYRDASGMASKNMDERIQNTIYENTHFTPEIIFMTFPRLFAIHELKIKGEISMDAASLSYLSYCSFLSF